MADPKGMEASTLVDPRLERDVRALVQVRRHPLPRMTPLLTR